MHRSIQQPAKTEAPTGCPNHKPGIDLLFLDSIHLHHCAMSPFRDYHRRCSNNSFILDPGINFVKISARFVCVSSLATLIVPAAIASRTLWKLIAACFFFRVDSGLEFVTTAELSQNTAHSSGIGTPIIRNLYRSPSIISIAIRMASNSDP